MADHRGRCHCGNLEVSFRTDKDAAALAVRACQCGFCRRHGARTVTDPEGSITIRVREAGRLTRYRFGLAAADFLLCAVCGTYLAAVCEAGGRSYATLNVNCFTDTQAAFGAPTQVSYEGESRSARIRRRQARWTPVDAFVSGG